MSKITEQFYSVKFSGHCAGQDLLPDGPVEAIVKKNVTLETLVDLTENFTKFAWSFQRGSELVPIITITPTGDTVAQSYQGRVLVNRTNGFLTLIKVEARDRGYYYATMQTSELVKTGETMLRVLGESLEETVDKLAREVIL